MKATNQKKREAPNKTAGQRSGQSGNSSHILREFSKWVNSLQERGGPGSDQNAETDKQEPPAGEITEVSSPEATHQPQFLRIVDPYAGKRIESDHSNQNQPGTDQPKAGVNHGPLAVMCEPDRQRVQDERQSEKHRPRPSYTFARTGDIEHEGRCFPFCEAGNCRIEGFGYLRCQAGTRIPERLVHENIQVGQGEQNALRTVAECR